MSDTVVSLRGQSLQSERRSLFLNALADSYDRYVKDFSAEPDAVIYVLGGTHQKCRTGWHIEGNSRGAILSLLSTAGMAFLKEAME